MATVRLYHYTSERHLRRILSAGYLKTVESNISFKREHAGPDVVWLTTDETAERGLGLQGSNVDKTEIRFTVELDRRAVHKWFSWAKARGSSQQAMDVMAKGGGAGSWRVVERPIPSSEWVEVRNMRTGAVLLDQEALLGDGE